jgi:FKBP-type peptidyl-prolyl cis-trans isomerase FkpA
MKIMESRTACGLVCQHFAAGALVLTLAATLQGCGSNAPPPVAASTPVAQPIAGDVERTDFAPSLGIDLSKMLRRPTGLYVQDLQVGTGAVAASGRTAAVRYTGWLANGKQFDSGEITITLGANKVIRAWEDGALGMRVGGRRRLVTPPALAYGARGSPPVIPANAVLVFEMELLSVY